MIASAGTEGVIRRYRERLPLAADAPIISLGEGGTPLIRLEHVPARLGMELALYVKYEGLNPTGSFKDRGMTVAVSQALAEGYGALLCASTGNTSASAAAYAARAGIRAFVLIPRGKVAQGKLGQAMMHGATVLQIAGNFDQGMRLVKELQDLGEVCIVNSINSFRLQGQKTAAFEIIEQLGRSPDYHFLPVGNAGNISAYWMGYSEYYRDGLASGRPRMCGCQASGAAPFVLGRRVDAPDTVATAIRIGHPQSWDLARQAVQESGGWFGASSDEEILQAQQLLAEEGIFCEPASAVSLARLHQDWKSGRLEAGSMVVCTLTGHGLKDPDIAIRQAQSSLLEVPADRDAVRAVIRAHSARTGGTEPSDPIPARRSG